MKDVPTSSEAFQHPRVATGGGIGSLSPGIFPTVFVYPARNDLDDRCPSRPPSYNRSLSLSLSLSVCVCE